MKEIQVAMVPRLKEQLADIFERTRYNTIQCAICLVFKFLSNKEDLRNTIHF